jgi:type I restriction enzyme M protein
MHHGFQVKTFTNDFYLIDASVKDSDGNLRFIKDKNQNKLSEKHIQDILDAYFERKDIEKFAHVPAMKKSKQ